jgi:hypothetical protein
MLESNQQPLAYQAILFAECILKLLVVTVGIEPTPFFLMREAHKPFMLCHQIYHIEAH